MEQTAAAIEEMTSAMKTNAESASNASGLARGASQVAAAGGQIVSSAVSAMSAIDESSRRISDIISVIDEIAFQTNLLALNAAEHLSDCRREHTHERRAGLCRSLRNLN